MAAAGGCRLPITIIYHTTIITIFLVLVIIIINTSHALLFFHLPSTSIRYYYHPKRPSPNRIALFAAIDGKKNKSDNGDISRDDGSDSRNMRRYERRRGQHRHSSNNIQRHQESHATAAGVESLFSISLWRSIFKTTFITSSLSSTQKVPSSSSSLDIDIITKEENLPTIDCEWACNSITEQIQLQQMKYLLTSKLQNIVTPKQLHTTYYPDVYSDLRLLRFLRKSKPRDVLSSVERYRDFLQWRMENNVDEEIRDMMMDNNSNNSNTTAFVPPPDSRWEIVATYFPMKFDHVMIRPANTTATDTTSNTALFQPSAILYIGAFDTQGISEQIASTESDITSNDFINYWIYLYESIHFNLYQQSLDSGKMIFLDEVCDLKGLSIQQFSPYFVSKVMKPWLTMTQAYYPETTRRIYVLNAPSVVNLAWKLVTPLLSKGVSIVSAICICCTIAHSTNKYVRHLTSLLPLPTIILFLSYP